MHPVIARTFGGLSAQYYFRQFLFGLIFPIFVLTMLMQGERSLTAAVLMMMAANTLLYPYSRFVYESVMDFIIGENVFFGSAVLMLSVKLVTMTVCWGCAIFIAPVGLAYLYFHHSRTSR